MRCDVFSEMGLLHLFAIHWFELAPEFLPFFQKTNGLFGLLFDDFVSIDDVFANGFHFHFSDQAF